MAESQEATGPQIEGEIKVADKREDHRVMTGEEFFLLYAASTSFCHCPTDGFFVAFVSKGTDKFEPAAIGEQLEQVGPLIDGIPDGPESSADGRAIISITQNVDRGRSVAH